MVKLSQSINRKGLFQNQMMNGKIRPYTKQEAYYIIYHHYEDRTDEFIKDLIAYWGGKSPTQVYFREALQNILSSRHQ